MSKTLARAFEFQFEFEFHIFGQYFGEFSQILHNVPHVSLFLLFQS